MAMLRRRATALLLPSLLASQQAALAQDPANHFPPEYAELYPPPEEFPIAKHPTMHESQPTVAWYDQGNTLPSPVGMAAHHDVIRSGGIAGSWGSGAGQLPPAPRPLPSTPLDPRTKPMNVTLARVVRRNLYAAASYVDAQLGKKLKVRRQGLEREG